MPRCLVGGGFDPGDDVSPFAPFSAALREPMQTAGVADHRRARWRRIERPASPLRSRHRPHRATRARPATRPRPRRPPLGRPIDPRAARLPHSHAAPESRRRVVAPTQRASFTAATHYDLSSPSWIACVRSSEWSSRASIESRSPRSWPVYSTDLQPPTSRPGISKVRRQPVLRRGAEQLFECPPASRSRSAICCSSASNASPNPPKSCCTPPRSSASKSPTTCWRPWPMSRTTSCSPAFAKPSKATCS